MQKTCVLRIQTILIAAICLGMFTTASSGQETNTSPQPVWIYAHDLKVRKGGESDWEKAPKIGIELFRDQGSNGTGGATSTNLIAITQSGILAVIPPGEIGSNKKAEWTSAQDLRVRKSDEEKFSNSTAKIGVEVYKDQASGKLLFISQTAGIAFANYKAPLTDKDPVWHHALVLKVRAPKEESFGKDTKQFGIEVYKEGTASNLIYITESGMITTAVAPAKAPEAEKIKAPKHLHGFNFRVRKADEKKFSETTARFSVEVFQDENTGGLIYISETGSIAAVPAPSKIEKKLGHEWIYAMNLKARPGGETSFKAANSYGVEVFVDKNTGYQIYISDVGSIAVLPK